MTPEGHAALVAELANLKKVERPKVIQEIATARAHGDLSENAEYDAAKERQSFIEGRIREIESKLAVSEVIDPASIDSDRIQFGATVRLLDLDSDEEVTYKIVGHDEADPREGKLSIMSPIARALIGKQEGDEVEFKAPGGKRAFEVLEIRYV